MQLADLVTFQLGWHASEGEGIGRIISENCTTVDVALVTLGTRERRTGEVLTINKRRVTVVPDPAEIRERAAVERAKALVHGPRARTAGIREYAWSDIWTQR